MSKQETVYLILLLLIVLYSHQFYKINLEMDSSPITIESNVPVINMNNNDEIEENNTSSTIMVKSLV